MKKLILLISFSFLSCANLKKTNTETELKTDSSSVKETTKTETENNKKETISDYKANTLTYEPIDIKIPYYVNGQKYENVKVVNKSESEYKKINEEQQKQITTLINEINRLTSLLKQEVNTKDKDYSVMIESIANKLFLLIIIIVVLFIIVGFIKKRFNF